MALHKENQETSFYLKLLVKSSLFIFIASIISKLASYGYKVLIARSFGAEVYGLFSLALIIISIASSIAAIGLGDGLVRYISYYRGKKTYGDIRQLVRGAHSIFIFSSVLCTLLIILLTPIMAEHLFHNINFIPIMIGMAFVLPFSLLSNLSLGILRGFERVNTYTMLVNIYQNAAKFIFLGLLIMMGIGVISISISYILMFAGLYILSNYYSKKDLLKMPKAKIPPIKSIMSEVLSYAWPLMFVGILYSIFYWTDSLILGYFEDATQVGWYNAAITLVSLFGIAPDLFMQLFFPLISFKSSEGKKELIRRLTQQVTKWIYLLSAPLFLLLFLFSEHWLGFLFGDDFIIASSSLKILSIGALFASITGLSTSLLSIKGKTRLVLADFIIFTSINILLDLMLVPSLGMLGAAIATSTTQSLFIITAVIQVRRAYGFNPLRGRMRRLIAITLTLLITGIVASRILNSNFFNAVVISIVLLLMYAIGLYTFSLFDSEDKNIVKSIAIKLKFYKKTR